MSNPSEADATPIVSVQQLADYLAAGGKPKERWRIGTEHEKFGFRHADIARRPTSRAASARCWTGWPGRSGSRSPTTACRSG